MSNRPLRYCLLLFACSLTMPVLAADLRPDDWPQFRGPKRDGVSTDKGLLKQWPTGGPRLVWKCEGIGAGFSSVVAVGNRLYTLGDTAAGCHVFAIDRVKGGIVWKSLIGKTGGSTAPGPRGTPTVDGDSLYALGQFGDLVCLNLKDGKEKWKKNLDKDFKGKSGDWNFTESPLVDGDKLIVTPGGSEAAMLALNKLNGDLIWKGVVPSGESAGYSSIVPAVIGGKRQYIQLMSNSLVSFSAEDGKLLWRYGAKNDRFAGNTANIPTPIVKGEQVFASAGYGRGAALLTISVADDTFSAKEEYWVKALTNKHGGVINVGPDLFGDADDKGMPWCADFKTGTVKWSKQDRTKGSGSASITAADGMLYIHYTNGWVALVKPSDGTEVSAFKVGKSGSNNWAHPVVIGGKMYIREQDVVYCYDVKTK